LNISSFGVVKSPKDVWRDFFLFMKLIWQNGSK